MFHEIFFKALPSLDDYGYSDVENKEQVSSLLSKVYECHKPTYDSFRLHSSEDVEAERMHDVHNEIFQPVICEDQRFDIFYYESEKYQEK